MAYVLTDGEARELRPALDCSFTRWHLKRKPFAIAFFFLAISFFEHESYGQNPSKGAAAKDEKGASVTTTAKDGSGILEQTKNSDALNSSLKNARIDNVDFAEAIVTITTCESECDGAQLKLTIPADRVRAIQGLHTGDRVSFGASAQSVLQTIKLTSKPVTRTDRLLALGCALILCLLATALLTWWHPLKLIIGEDGRYSNSKFQMAVWFCVVIASYLGVVYLRLARIGWDFLGGVNIPSNLLLLSGMSALTFAGAKGITTAKVDAAIAQGNANPKPVGTPQFWKNLVQNDLGAFDFGDFQMLVVTLLAVGMYVASVFHFLNFVQVANSIDLPNVDTTILATFGLGQGAYLTKKAVGKAASS